MVKNKKIKIVNKYTEFTPVIPIKDLKIFFGDKIINTIFIHIPRIETINNKYSTLRILSIYGFIGVAQLQLSKLLE
jgi:hypothetical protein